MSSSELLFCSWKFGGSKLEMEDFCPLPSHPVCCAEDCCKCQTYPKASLRTLVTFDEVKVPAENLLGREGGVD